LGKPLVIGEAANVAEGAQDAPLPKSEKPLHYDASAGLRIR